MFKKKATPKRIPENYLLRIPVRPEAMKWSADENGIVTLEKENTGIMNRIAQKLLGKPPVSYIHLDKNGSFAWLSTDGERDITAIGTLVEAKFGEEAHPLYERLAMFYQVLDSYGFIQWKE